MKYDRSSTREKWTIMMYMRRFDLMATYAYALRLSNDLSMDNIDEILVKMEEEEIYHPRNGGSTFTGQFKYIQIAWYLFGYYNNSKKHGKKKKMVFSPLGNLLLDNIKDPGKTTKIFMAMLFAIGFRHPFSQMDVRFNIYAFRLLFMLLRDPRLCGKLYSDEVFYLVMFIKTITPEEYEELVQDILDLRKSSVHAKLNCFLEDECVLGLACHEWRYLTGMLESAGIITVCNDHGNRIVGRLGYGKKDEEGKYSVYRSYREDYVVLREEVVSFADKMLESYPYYERPHPNVTSGGRTTGSSATVGMYFFYPVELLEELGMDTKEDKAVAAMLQIASEVNGCAGEEAKAQEESKKPQVQKAKAKKEIKPETAGEEEFKESEETEISENYKYTLNEAFKMFSDVSSERISKAGNTDIECTFYPAEGAAQKKFDVEVRLALKRVISHVLKTHRKKTGAQYSIIVASSYTSSVLKDIEGNEAVIIKPAALANYLYQSILKYGRKISYADLDHIIEENKGKDITEIVDNFVFGKFGHGAQDFTHK